MSGFLCMKFPLYPIPVTQAGRRDSAIQQGYAFSCAIRCQEIILRDYDIWVSEAELVRFSLAQAWLGVTGTQLEDMGNILNYYGISCLDSISFICSLTP